MLELIDAVQREVARQFPATVPWRWHHEFGTSACETDGLKLYFPNLGSAHGLSDDEWAQVLPAVTRLAADAGLTDFGGAGQNTSGNHDVRITSTDGRELVFGARVATLITASVGCRRSADPDLWVDGHPDTARPAGVSSGRHQPSTAATTSAARLSDPRVSQRPPQSAAARPA